MKNLKTMLAAAALAAATSAHGQTMVSSIHVEANLDVLKNIAAAEVWYNVEEDLEEAIASRLVGQTSDDGSSVIVRMDTVMLASSIEQQLGIDESELKGKVLIVHPDNRSNSVYDLTVKTSAARIPDGVATLPITSEEFYDVMIEAFADNVVEKLE